MSTVALKEAGSGRHHPRLRVGDIGNGLRQIRVGRSARCFGKSSDDLVFTAPKGGVIYLRNWRPRVWDPAVQKAGLGRLSPHELRHTAASLAVAAGGNVKVVQRMLGHASAAMTLDTYSGLFDDDLDAVADRVDEAAARVVLGSIVDRQVT